MPVARRSGVPFCLHDLRRTFATIADSLDIPGYAVKALLNHKGGSDVTAGYVVASTERLREPMQKICDYVLRCAGVEGSAPVVPFERADRPVRGVLPLTTRTDHTKPRVAPEPPLSLAGWLGSFLKDCTERRVLWPTKKIGRRPAIGLGTIYRLRNSLQIRESTAGLIRIISPSLWSATSFSSAATIPIRSRSGWMKSRASKSK
jgi:hypothetical protein